MHDNTQYFSRFDRPITHGAESMDLFIAVFNVI